MTNEQWLLLQSWMIEVEQAIDRVAHELPKLYTERMVLHGLKRAQDARVELLHDALVKGDGDARQEGAD